VSFANRHDVEDWLAEHADGGVIVEIGCGYGHGVNALHKGTSKGNQLKIYAIDPYAPYTDTLGASYGPETLTEFHENTLNVPVCHIRKSAEEARKEWTEPVALLWIDVSMPYAPLKHIFDLWQDTVIPGGVIAITGHTYAQLGTEQVAKEAVASGAYDYALHEQDWVAVLKKK
jgi:hypothetical protein